MYQTVGKYLRSFFMREEVSLSAGRRGVCGPCEATVAPADSRSKSSRRKGHINPKAVKYYTMDRLREEFHISKLFTKDSIRMVYSHIDRIITTGIMSVYQELKLEGGKEIVADYFLERREMGCINIGEMI